MDKLKLETLISEEKIQKRIAEMGAELTKKFKGQDIVAICVLRGAFMFYADLIRRIECDIKCEFFGVSSYAKMQSSGEVKLTMDLTMPVQGKHILLVEDIVDTGNTMNYLVKSLQAREPKSITTASLLFKPAALKTQCQLDYVGFEIGNDFVVGYGLDYDGKYRNLPHIALVNNFN
jgi:hypoxanthine phosphoribosyltransferase